MAESGSAVGHGRGIAKGRHSQLLPEYIGVATGPRFARLEVADDERVKGRRACAPALSLCLAVDMHDSRQMAG